ncbi:MAG TPA: response regulator, partial [Burkholderiales bacterium]|nr:response regulator [Burkholderiales bacterium]
RVPGAAGLWRDLTDNVNQLAANLTSQVRAIAEVATAVAKGDLTRSIAVEAMGEVAVLKDNINQMIRNLKETILKNNEQDWLKTNLAKFTRMLQGHGDLVAVARLIMSELAPLVHAQHGLFYVPAARRPEDEPCLELLASYARMPKSTSRLVRYGDGLVGQCALEKKSILMEDVPEDFLRVSTGLGSVKPANIIVLPVVFEGEVKAVVELAALKKFSESHLSFLSQLTETIGVVFNTIEANMRTQTLLEQSQTLTRELQVQQLELKETNDRLELQAQNLQNSEGLLKSQQEELQRTNEELQDKARLLSEQMRQVELKNREVEQARAALEEKAEQLALSSRYKSEFLANMSHELRTPLNSLLILAKLLTDNPGSNLTQKQIDYAQTIYAAGADLLSLINDILDLAKIESGTITLDIMPEQFTDLRDFVERTFRQVAQDKGLDFTVELDDALPAQTRTDEKRLQQILKNLLSNAFKFTEEGSVVLRIGPAASGWTPGHDVLDAAEEVIVYSVTDTGIGIPENKHKVIFEAFQQADGTTSRRYGGTGLGLSISRELARLLGGEILVESEPGKGSTFTLYLPLNQEASDDEAKGPQASRDAVRAEAAPAAPKVSEKPGLLPANIVASEPRLAPALPKPIPADDRADIHPDDRVVLIVEDDARFAAILLDVARESGFKGVIATDGALALSMVKEFSPDAVTLDLKLPDTDGWAVLDQLKHDPETRHIPVSVISVENEMHKCLQLGALQAVRKPAQKDTLVEALAKTRRIIDNEVKRLLVAEADEAQRAGIASALADEEVQISAFGSGREVLEALRRERFDCLVVGPKLADMTAIGLIRSILESGAGSEMPVVIYDNGGLGEGEQDNLKKLAEIAVLKNARTLQSVLRETTLFLHQAVDDLPVDKRKLLAGSYEASSELAGRKVLIVDDDVRNIFALSGALEQHGMTVLSAENGTDGIEVLKNNPGIDVVLMDIMMPELDGYDTIRIVRGLEEFKDLPVIAVTAKAMKGDREKCLMAGASDYLSKPVNVEQLLSLMRVRLAA